MGDESSDAMGPPPVAPNDPGNPIAVGDAAAAGGDWVLAIQVWEHLLGTPHQAAASQRLRWFLIETGEGVTSPGARVSRGQALAAGVALAIVATTSVFLGQSQSGSSRNTLSAVAWVCYITSAALLVTFAFAGGSSPGPGGELADIDLTRARARAQQLDSGCLRNARET